MERKFYGYLQIKVFFHHIVIIYSAAVLTAVTCIDYYSMRVFADITFTRQYIKAKISRCNQENKSDYKNKTYCKIQDFLKFHKAEHPVLFLCAECIAYNNYNIGNVNFKG